ncbi:MAG: DUF1501 domain-containing protein [Proteobacteria bacterium]|uniref:DUF1501 domain-containing protein n=1 Tax=Aquabacterium sp. TaxID=1872578 RepID=UPI0035C74FCE|nr:DUF1501 domain-containing protein [Pseudomonadota bacterium]
MSHTPHPDRRRFLRHAASAAGMGALGAALPFGLNLGALTRASAQSAGGGYRALVCLFFNGGNDAFNTVLATDSASWGHYLYHRRPTDGSTSIALMEAGTAPVSSAAGSAPERLGGVLPISHAGRAVHAGRAFALHPALTRLQAMHQAGRACVVANVGPLTRPTTKADYASPTASKPAKLFSHNDQQSTWQSFKPEGAGEGWGGLMGDLLMSGNGGGRSASDAAIVQRLFTCMTPAQTSVWLAGRAVLPYQSGATGVQALGNAGRIYGNAGLQSAVASVMGGLGGSGGSPTERSSLFVLDQQKLVQRALTASDLLGSQLAPLGNAPWSSAGVTNIYSDPLLKYTSPIDGTQRFNGVALQLQMIARLIDTNRTANLGITRQLFMVNMGGFDTHDNQIAEQADRLASLDHALGYFDNVLSAMPGGDLRSQVTTFTASEFGRSFTSNGDGTDHGWGSHHVVMGGAVNGTEVYGSFPQYSSADSTGAFSSPDQIHNGVLIPSTSVDQYAYTLGKWMGVGQSDLLALLPNLGQFGSGTHDLGFMKA